jgi:hypothetical protein
MKNIAKLILSVAALLVSLSGCYVPKAYQIENTVDPKYEDEDVRFRTTYYLRVFDLCRVDEQGKYGKYDTGVGKFTHRTAGQYRIVKDSLYRFKMTGQSQGYNNDVRFESGTLRDYEIDPFGRTIDFEKHLKRGPTVSSSPGGQQSQVKIQENGGAKTPTQPSENPRTVVASHEGASMQSRPDPCPDTEAKDTKFYLLGPEGIKELLLSERLVMAMSTDAKPLISALQRVAGIKAQSEADTTAQYRIKRNQARAAVATDLLHQAKKKLETGEVDESTTPDALRTAILDLFSNEVTP